MRETTVKISVTQDGLLPEEVTLLGKIFLPIIQKQILKSTGFEKIDDSTFAGVVPIKITTNAKVQEIEFEVGAIPDFRKKVVEFVNEVSIQEFIKEDPLPIEEDKPEKKTKVKAKNSKDKDKKSAKKTVKAKTKKVKKPASSKKTLTTKKSTKKDVAKKSTSAKKATRKKVMTKSKGSKK